VVSHILKFADDVKIFGKVDEEIDKRQMDKDLDIMVDWTHTPTTHNHPRRTSSADDVRCGWSVCVVSGPH